MEPIVKRKNKKAAPKGLAVYKKMLEDKKAIQQHLQNGGKLADLKNKYRFVKPLSASGS